MVAASSITAGRVVVTPRLAFDPMTARLGLGLAALGRPGYVTLNHASDLGGRYDPSSMELHTHHVLDAAFEAGIRPS